MAASKHWRLVGPADDRTECPLIITDGPREDGSVGGHWFTGQKDGGFGKGERIYEERIARGDWK